MEKKVLLEKRLDNQMKVFDVIVDELINENSKISFETIFKKLDDIIENDFDGKKFNVFYEFNEVDYASNIIVANFLKLNFIKNNIKIFNKHDNSDNIPHLFMQMNDFLYQILNRKNVYIIGKNSTSVIQISWNEKTLTEENYNEFENIEKNWNKYNNIIIGDLYIYGVLENANLKDNLLIELYFYITKPIYEYFINYILKLNENYSFEYCEKGFSFDLKTYKNNKLLVLSSDFDITKLKVLHLSDMHIKDNSIRKIYELHNKLKSDSLYRYSKSDNYESIEKFNDFDLLVVTGDVANAGASSKEIISNYYNSYKQIKLLGQILFKNIWKSRIIIIPGNHDYGIINELKIELKDRAYKSTVVTGDTEEFEKFIFFHFIFEIDLLNETIQMTRNQKYPKVKKFKIGKNEVNFYLFNTTEKANVYRSNKVGFKYNKIDTSGKNCIILMHHTPLLEVNYYMDTFDYTYYEEQLLRYIYGCCNSELKDFNELIEKNKDILINNIKNKNIDSNKFIEKIKNFITEMENRSIDKLKENEEIISLTRIKSDDFIKILEDTKNEYGNLIDFFFDKVKNILEEYIKKIEKCCSINEELCKIVTDYNNINSFNEEKRNKIINSIDYFKNSVNDYNEYNLEFLKCLENIKNPVILGGHYHKNRARFKEEYKVFEVGKTFDKNEFNYGVLVIKFDKETDNIYYCYPRKLERDL